MSKNSFSILLLLLKMKKFIGLIRKCFSSRFMTPRKKSQANNNTNLNFQEAQQKLKNQDTNKFTFLLQ